MATLSASPAREAASLSPPAPGRTGRLEFIMLILACYILAFGTFENFGALGGADRTAPGQLHFDTLAAIKTAARVTAFALAALSFASLARSPRRRYVLTCLRPLFLFSLWGILTALWSPLAPYSLGHALEFFLLTLIAATAALACDRPERFCSLLHHACLIQVLFLVALVALYLADPRSASLLRSPLESERALFSASEDAMFIKNPAETACVAALAVILAVAMRLLWGWPWTRRLLLPGLALGGWVLLVTQSRAPISTALVLSALTVAVWCSRRTLAAASLLLCLGLSLYLAADPNLDRIATVTGKAGGYLSRGQSAEELHALDGRMTNWTGVAEALKAHPQAILIGFGYSMASPTGMMWREGELRRYTGHNILLDVLAGTGLVGLSLFGWGVARLLRLVGKGLKGPDRRLPFLALLALLFALMTGIFGDSVVGPMDPTSVAIFLILGLGLWRVAMPEGHHVPGAPGRSA